MRFIGGKSGFKTARDLIFCITGLGLCIFHVVTTAPDDLSVPFLLFAGGLAGCPAFMRQDEKREEKRSNGKQE